MADRVTYQGIEQYATPGTGVPRVTYQGIEQYATPGTGVPRVTYMAIEQMVDLNPLLTRTETIVVRGQRPDGVWHYMTFTFKHPIVE